MNEIKDTPRTITNFIPSAELVAMVGDSVASRVDGAMDGISVSTWEEEGLTATVGSSDG